MKVLPLGDQITPVLRGDRPRSAIQIRNRLIVARSVVEVLRVRRRTLRSSADRGRAKLEFAELLS